MSNSVVGDIYNHVIEEVMESSRPDFEDHDADQDTLTALKVLWQTKLANTGVASFPWNRNNGNEPGAAFNVDHPASPRPSMFPKDNTSQAALRAAQQIQALAQRQGNVGSWNETVNNLQAYANAHLQSRSNEGSPGGMGLPPFPKEESNAGSSLLLPQLNRPRSQMAEVKQEYDPPSFGPDLSTSQIDEVIAQRAHNFGNRKRRASGSPEAAQSETPPAMGYPNIPQHDGAGSTGDNDGDDDAINSDLDDPESDLDPDENEEGADMAGQNIVLCQYDRVARVKNKWKCVLKDGIVGINGKDYVFIRGNGYDSIAGQAADNTKRV